MEAVDLVYLCRSLAALSGIPVRVFRGEERVCFHAPVPLPRDPMEVCRREIWALTGHVGYIITSRFHVYGVVRSGDYRLVAGPTAQILASGQSLRELAFQADVPPEETQAFIEAIRQIVPMPLESLLQGYVRLGLAKQVDDRWRFTPRGFLLSNQLIGELLDAQAEQRYKPRPYSPE